MKTKNINQLLLAVGFILSLYTQAGFARTPASVDANEIVKKADKFRGFTESVFVKATVVDKPDNRKSVFNISSKNPDESLVEQVFPERSKGRKMLMKSYDMWLFTPDIKKPIRIGLEQRLTGEVANGDIARTNYSLDYDAKILAEEVVNKKPSYKIELKAKNKKVTYNKIEYWVTKAESMPLKAVFYSLSGKALKTAEFTGFKKVLGSNIATKMIITSALKKKDTSELIFSDYKKQTFSESLFNKDGMDF